MLVTVIISHMFFNYSVLISRILNTDNDPYHYFYGWPSRRSPVESPAIVDYKRKGTNYLCIKHRVRTVLKIFDSNKLEVLTH